MREEKTLAEAILEETDTTPITAGMVKCPRVGCDWHFHGHDTTAARRHAREDHPDDANVCHNPNPLGCAEACESPRCTGKGDQ